MDIVKEDLDSIVKEITPLLKELNGKTIFLTGGTGFFGLWLLRTFKYCNENLDQKLSVIILTRDIYKAKKIISNNDKLPDNFSLIEGDIVDFQFPSIEIDYIIHAATDASMKLNSENPLKMFETIVLGTKHILDLAIQKSVKSFIYVSTGGVYGQQPHELTNITEAYTGGPEISNPASVYSESKRMAEVLCGIFYHKHKVPVKIARCFAFIGPGLPLDEHFAVGNFINDILNNRNIDIKGDGTPVRSYMYTSDLVIWLLKILLKGSSNYPYNVGSDMPLSIEEAAKHILAVSNKKNLKVNIAQKKSTSFPLRYLPDISRAKIELGLQIKTSFTEAVRRTLIYHKSISQHK